MFLSVAYGNISTHPISPKVMNLPKEVMRSITYFVDKVYILWHLKYMSYNIRSIYG